MVAKSLEAAKSSAATRSSLGRVSREPKESKSGISGRSKPPVPESIDSGKSKLVVCIFSLVGLLTVSVAEKSSVVAKLSVVAKSLEAAKSSAATRSSEFANSSDKAARLSVKAAKSSVCDERLSFVFGFNADSNSGKPSKSKSLSTGFSMLSSSGNE